MSSNFLRDLLLYVCVCVCLRVSFSSIVSSFIHSMGWSVKRMLIYVQCKHFDFAHTHTHSHSNPTQWIATRYTVQNPLQFEEFYREKRWPQVEFAMEKFRKIPNDTYTFLYVYYISFRSLIMMIHLKGNVRLAVTMLSCWFQILYYKCQKRDREKK